MGEASFNKDIDLNEVNNIDSDNEVIDKVKRKIDVKNIIMLVFDYIVIIASYVISLMALCTISTFMFDFSYMYYICLITPFYAIFVSVVFYAFGLYSKNYKTVGIHEVRRLLISNFFMILFYVILMNLIFKVGFPYVFFLVGGLLQFTFSMGIRFLYRLLKE